MAIAAILVVSAYLGYQSYVLSQISLDEAIEAYEAEDYARAAALLERVAERKQLTPGAWFALADSKERLGEYEDALLAYFKAEDRRFNPPETLFRMSVIYARTGAPTKAIVWYQKALRAGFEEFERLDAQPDLARILDSEEAKQITIYNEQEAKSVDFILGEWSVRASNRSSVPYVSITKSDDGQTITERQFSRSSALATVVYERDHKTNTWKVTGDYGDQGTFEGTMSWSGRSLRIVGTVTDADGNTFRRQKFMTPEAGGRFRSSVIDGETRQQNDVVEYVFTPRSDGTNSVSF